MPLFKKKPSEKAAAPAVPAWHPNFRNFERLPDTKVVRTSFFINVAAVSLTLALAIWMAVREYTVHDYRTQVQAQEDKIAAAKAGNSEALAQFKKFQDEEKKIAELADFADTKLVLSEFLLHLGETLPPKVQLTFVDYKPAGVTLRGSVDGSPVEASGGAAAYFEQLKSDAQYGGLFENLRPTLSRNPETGRLVFELNLEFKAPAAKTPASK